MANLKGELKFFALHPCHASVASLLLRDGSEEDELSPLEERSDDVRVIVLARILLFVCCRGASSDDDSEAEDKSVVSVEVSLAVIDDFVSMSCVAISCGKTVRASDVFGGSRIAGGKKAKVSGSAEVSLSLLFSEDHVPSISNASSFNASSSSCETLDAGGDAPGASDLR
jgi:hypothetical protein